MRIANRVLCFLALIVAIPYSTGYSATLDCMGGTIFVEDSRTDVLVKCGEPDWKESHQEEIIERLDVSTKQKLLVTVEEWTYNHGPSQFMRIITLKNSNVTDIRYGDYGYTKSTTPAPKPEQRECGDRIISIGDAKSDILMKCGEPAGKDTRQEELKETLPDGQIRKTVVTIDSWTYNFGPNRFVRVFTFRNGIISDIKTGGYGY